MRDHVRQSLAVLPDQDPAMLAFVKCHVTSFVKWDVLRALSDRSGFWVEPSQLAREINRPADKVREALHGLTTEGIVERAGLTDEPIFRLTPDEPTTLVVNKLIGRSTENQELRKIVVAHILQAAVA
ncbi:MAG: hypothetical protein U0821_02215 [Chloroflexota bacterium]